MAATPKKKAHLQKVPCRNRLPDRRMTGYRIPQLRPDPHPHLPRDRLNKKHSPARGFCYTLALRDEAERRDTGTGRNKKDSGTMDTEDEGDPYA